MERVHFVYGGHVSTFLFRICKNTRENQNYKKFTLPRLSPAVGALYVRKFFNDDQAKRHAIGIVENIRSSFTEMLTQIDWMDDITKTSAIDKANALVTHIAYPNELVDNTKLEEFYKGLEIDESEYLLNALAMHKFKVDYMFRELYTPVNKTEWISHATPAMTNAFYSALENSICTFYIIFTQFPMYRAKLIQQILKC